MGRDHSIDLDLVGWKAVIAAATRGTWTADKMTDGSVWVQSEHNDGVSGIFEHIGSNEADAAFIAAARSALPACIQRVEALEREVARLHALVDEATDELSDTGGDFAMKRAEEIRWRIAQGASRREHGR